MWIVLGVALLLRLLALVHGHAVPTPHGDEGYYVGQAVAIAAGEGFPGSFRPPLYSMFLGSIFAVVGQKLLIVRLAQIFLSLISVALCYAMARDRFGLRGAFVTGIACAVSPGLIHFSHFLWSETLFITLFLLFLRAAQLFHAAPAVRQLVVAGLALGLAALTREIVVFYSGVVILGLLLRDFWRPGLRHALIFCVCFLLPIVPWVVRNSLEQQAPVGLSTCRWFPIAVGNLRAEDERFGTETRTEFLSRWRGMDDELEKETISREAALASIERQQPGWLPHKFTMNLKRLFSPKVSELRFIELGLYPRTMAGWARRGYVLAGVTGLLLLAIPGLAGMWLARGDPLKWLALVMVLYSIAIYTLANATPRFLIPLLPLFYLFLAPWFEEKLLAIDRRRLAAAGVTFALLCWVVLSQLGQLASIWG